MSSDRFVALVPAAGSGSRLGHALPKQYLPLGAWPMIRHTVTRLAAHPRIERVAVVLSAGDEWFDGEGWDGLSGKLQVLRCGGDTRAATVRNGVEALAADFDGHAWVLVHDAARPCLGRVLLDRLIAALEHDPTLWDFAFERRVLLASPTNLVAIARTIAQVWQQEGLAREAREIGKLAADLYDSLAKTQDDLVKTGVHLGRAVNSFNDFARTYEGNVMSRARRLTEKHIKIGKREITEDVPLVEAMPRFADVPDAAALLADAAEGE